MYNISSYMYKMISDWSMKRALNKYCALVLRYNKRTGNKTKGTIYIYIKTTVYDVRIINHSDFFLDRST